MGLFYETIGVVFFLIAAHIAIYVWTSSKPSKSIKKRHVVITGGSSGIGFWIAVNCAKLGAHVTIIARNVDNLKTALEKIRGHRVDSDQKFEYISLDLSADYAAIETALKELESRMGTIYMLTNCAGGAICGRIDESPVSNAVHMMNINYFSVYHPTRFVLEQMRKNNEGIITITGSQLSLLGMYGYGNYAAAKFALRGLAETLVMEMCNTDVTVTLALPADTDTPGFENENKTKPEETKIISASGGLAKPEVVAEKILHDSLSGTFISVSGTESWIVAMICSGMSPWNGFWFSVLQSMVVGPLRFVAYGLHWYWRRVVRSIGVKRMLEELGVKKEE